MSTPAPVIDALSKALAGSYILLLKTQNYHWNVTGPNFFGLHTMFEAQYTDLFAAVDVLAERIRALGAPAPGSFAAFAKISPVAEATGNPTPEEMIADLAASHDALVGTMQAAARTAAEAGDDVSQGLVNGREEIHAKTAWMLHSMSR